MEELAHPRFLVVLRRTVSNARARRQSVYREWLPIEQGRQIHRAAAAGEGERPRLHGTRRESRLPPRHASSK